jgi:hypothetical protein
MRCRYRSRSGASGQLKDLGFDDAIGIVLNAVLAEGEMIQYRFEQSIAGSPGLLTAHGDFRTFCGAVRRMVSDVELGSRARFQASSMVRRRNTSVAAKYSIAFRTTRICW